MVWLFILNLLQRTAFFNPILRLIFRFIFYFFLLLYGIIFIFRTLISISFNLFFIRDEFMMIFEMLYFFFLKVIIHQRIMLLGLALFEIRGFIRIIFMLSIIRNFLLIMNYAFLSLRHIIIVFKPDLWKSYLFEHLSFLFFHLTFLFFVIIYIIINLAFCFIFFRSKLFHYIIDFLHLLN